MRPGPCVSDDAGRGRRGRRPVLREDLLRSGAQAYGLTVRSATDLGGSVNLNARLETSAGPYVLRAYRRHAGEERVRAIQRARAAMAAAGIPAATPLETTAGDVLVTVDGVIVEVEPFVPSDAKMDTLSRVQAALPTLGAVHEAFRTLDLGAAADQVEFANHVPADRLIERVARGTDRIRRWSPTKVERDVADTADRLAAEIERLSAGEPAAVQLTHGDFWDDNVLFRDGEVALVADLDFMVRRRRIDDLALILFYTRYLLADPPAPATLAPLLAAYDAGATVKLTPDERAALPLAMARQPLWSLAVWVASLDDEATARQHLDGHLEAVEWGRQVLADLDRWQQGFA